MDLKILVKELRLNIIDNNRKNKLSEGKFEEWSSKCCSILVEIQV